ncbi:MAG TPA: PDZ domain-containing protein [Pyrinomonadaceae bacterium]|nr:PDZ domain-containing protein [Pyrinomonadaceae bacterium]
MQNEQYANRAAEVICPSCRASLTAGLRFCRMCGYRLGEGTDEYNETRRFDAAAGPAAAAAGAPPRAADPFASRRTADPFAPQSAWGAVPMAPLAPGAGSTFGRLSRACNPARMGWFGWLVLSLALIFAVGIGVKMMRGQRSAGAVRQAQISVSIPREVDGFETADGGGVFIEGLSGPDTSIERAGLLGGDIIISLDNQAVRNVSALRRVLAATPPGKSVEVVFIRDGERRTAALNTMHEKEYRGMEPIDSRPGGRGLFGVDVGSRVRLPDSNLYGVELDGVNRNGPAGLSGLKRGDVVVEVNGKPTRTSGDLRLRIYEAMPGSTIPVVVFRDGQRMEMQVKVGSSRDN